ncbi:1-deoxy-D-xylulose-5-phosphate reductoisomerase [Kamptonema cortianum]|nr:1-deoxy-D-xylulose-5-phosphate reductoisomerase [Geitlerinema splendidum]MDK3155961.1 1-deoxy-D-xylulose-5-phosphate reductoisomerase [Kamptonema cortianum]
MKRIVVLGSTGSIGTQTLQIVKEHSDKFQIVGLVANKSASHILSQGKEFNVRHLALMDEKAADESNLPGGMNAVLEIATLAEADIVVVAVAGVIGLEPTISAIKAGKDIALASKEVLVAAGEIVMPLIRDNQVKMTPIDSEHSALWQCLEGTEPANVDTLILTASGGPFRGMNREQLATVTIDQTLSHPTWNMGGKITVDSATLMNKGLEIIEAKWLFNMPLDKIEVVVHPQSIVHSMVKFRDGSVLGQMGWPDMRLPILYALSHPDRVPNTLKPWNPAETPNLSFEKPDEEAFAGLRLAREAGMAGGTIPCALNAANEVAANAFLRGKCGFLQITEVVETVVMQHKSQSVTLESLLEVDGWARETARRLLQLG